MGSKRIKGITIEIGGDTQGLNQALKETNGSIKNTQAQLKDVERLLKLDPSNTVVLQQKQELLAKSIEDTGKKLETLKTASEQAARSADQYDSWKAKFTPIQQEIDQTKAKLKELEAAQREMKDGGQVESEQYAALQNEIKETSSYLKQLKKDADAVNTEFGNPISHDQYNALQREIAETEANLKALKSSSEQTEQALKGIGAASEGTTKKLSGLCEVVSGGAMLQAAESLSGLGDKITELGGKATEAFAEAENATVKASSYFGETGEAAEETAEVIKNVYGAGVGESMDSVSNAVITVKKNIQDLDSTELTNLTEQAITLEDLYGIDMNETMRGVNSLMEQFGLSAQEAMDYIVAGTENGLDKTDELGDNLSEYAGKFAQAGYSASEYFQLLNNGLDGGAYNLDKVNDAINEVTTRLADGTIEEAIGSYSTETQGLFKAWQDGGATQKQVIDSIVKDIAGCQSQQESLNMAATAFGTMAEDGNLKFIESLTSVGSAYDNVSGSAQNLYNQTSTPMQEMESNTRKLQQALAPLGEVLINLANQILPPLVSGIQTLSGFFSSLPGPVQNFVVILGALLAGFTALAPVIAAVVLAFTTLGAGVLAPVIGIIAGVAAAIAGIIAAIQNWGSIVQWIQGVWETMKQVFETVWNGILIFFTETIPQAWQSVVEFFAGIPEWWSGVWGRVSGVFETVWNGILIFFTETIPQAWQSVVEFFAGIPEWWSGVWGRVSEKFVQIWTEMMENPVLSAIVEMILTLWNNCMENLSLIWNTIQTVALSAWELIKNTIMGPVLLLCDLILGDFDKLRADAEQIWNNIKNAANTIWTALKNLVVNLVTNLKNSVTAIISGLRDAAAGLWEAIREKASELWNTILETIMEIVTGIKDKAIETFNNLKDGISEKVSQIPQVVEEGFQGAIDFITSLPEKAVKWGKDFIGGLIEGIKSKVEDLMDAVGDIADSIADFLHFSRPDKGPLHYYESWMPDFMMGLEKGLKNNMWRVLDQVKRLNTEMSLSMQPGAIQASRTLNLQNHSVLNVDGKVIAETVNEYLGVEL